MSEELEALPTQKGSSHEELVHALQLVSLLGKHKSKEVSSALCSATFFLDLLQTLVWSGVWALTPVALGLLKGFVLALMGVWAILFQAFSMLHIFVGQDVLSEQELFAAEQQCLDLGYS